jgi:uncharacterized protein (TIGR02453 family)
MAAYFSATLFTFLRQLKAHNDRAWFLDHRDQYVRDVEAPMLQFITDVGPRLRSISRALVADPRRSGGSMYRIYRDTRFSVDKSPYKTHVAAHFAHEARKTVPSVPGFYLHLEPRDSLGGGGIYHPDPQALARIRLAIVERGKDWAAVKKSGLAIEGDRLTRAPAGFDPAHPCVADLRQKDFYALVPFTEETVCGPDFLDHYAEACERVAPLVRFIARSLDLKW